MKQENYPAFLRKQKDDSLYIIEIVKVIENEVVVRLKDGSHHSILLKDQENALRLQKKVCTIISN